MWRTSRKCAHPLHGTRKNKPEKRAGLDMSKYIMAKWNVLVPVGSGRSIFFVEMRGKRCCPLYEQKATTTKTNKQTNKIRSSEI